MNPAPPITPAALAVVALGLAMSVTTLGVARPLRGSTIAVGSASSSLALAGTWSGPEWGEVVIAGDGSGSYHDTYGTGPGRLLIRQVGERTYVGSWGESSRRFGTLTLTLSSDGRSVTGTWSPDAHSTIGTPTGGPVTWARR